MNVNKKRDKWSTQTSSLFFTGKTNQHLIYEFTYEEFAEDFALISCILATFKTMLHTIAIFLWIIFMDFKIYYLTGYYFCLFHLKDFKIYLLSNFQIYNTV